MQELTAKATWEVALGAGARGLVHYAYKLSPSDRGSLVVYEREKLFDHVLAINYVKEALRCHAGTLTEIYLRIEIFWVQKGKDLKKTYSLVGTDETLVFAGDPEPFLIDELRLDGPYPPYPTSASTHT